MNADQPDRLVLHNQSAFNDLMKNASQADRDWLISYVESLGLSMRSKEWLQAAITARLTLDMLHVEQRTNAAAAFILKNIETNLDMVDQRINSLTSLINQDGADRRTLVASIPGITESSISAMEARLSGPFDVQTESVRGAARQGAIEGRAIAAEHTASTVVKSIRLAMFTIGLLLVVAVIMTAAVTRGSSRHTAPSPAKSYRLQKHVRNH